METENEAKVLTVDEIALLREVARWRRANGVSYFQWRPGCRIGVFTEWYRYDGRKRETLSYEPGSESRCPQVVVTHAYYGGEDKVLPVETVTQAIDVLVALGYLPQRFSSAYRAGWNASGSLIGVGNDVIADLEAKLEPAVR
jgi:hypothetical protein